MKYSRFYAIGISMTVAILSMQLTPAAAAKNKVVEYMKYFSPMPQKNYTNESQDRLIKKQSFKKAGVLPETPPVKNTEIGFFAVLPANKLTQVDYAESLLANEQTSGLSVLIPWSTLEPSEEKYEWNTIDSLLTLCQKHNKSLILRVATCGVDTDGDATKPSSNTPAWVFENGAKSVKYLDKDNKAHLMPVFWDQTYLAAFSNFINEMGSRYDKNLLIHSVGITGGGYRGGTSVVPSDLNNKSADKTATNETGFSSADQINDYLREQHAMNQKQIIDHWKYVADLFPKAFPNTRLNFAINPPTPNRAGEDALDDISDYLLFRYGEHIYITRQDLKNGKHTFDDYRVSLKFRPDTYVGLALSPSFEIADMDKIAKTALDDGISFIEIPPDILNSSDETVKHAITVLASHMGFQLISQKTSIPAEIAQGEQLKAEFSFLNVGDTSPKRPVRELDKDVAGSYKVMLEIKDESGKVVAKILHTPDRKTETWKTGETITWSQSLRMPQLPAGEYEASVSLVDPDNNKKLNILDGRNADKKQIQADLALGKLKIVGPSTANKTVPN